MATIYCLTEWNDKMQQVGCEYFMSLNGVVNNLIAKNAIDNKFTVRDREIAGDYDITVENIRNVFEACERNNMAASFAINQDFGFYAVETRYTLSTINVND